MLQAFTLFYHKRKDSFKTLPSFLHLLLFLFVVFIAILSLNFEVFRVMRLGDLLLLVLAVMVGIHWYGQKMLEAGYRDGLSNAVTKKTTRNHSA